MNYNIYLIFILSSICLLFADPPDWTDDPGAYEFTSTISGGIVLNTNGDQMGECYNIDSNGLCIDEIQDMFAAFDDDGNVRGVGIMLFPPFGPHQGTPVYEMQMRSNSEGDLLHFKYYDASEDVVLDIIETYEFIINDILGDVIDPIFFNIETGDEECIDDDACPVYGCTDSATCNYNPDATEDDGSCVFPEENYDCDGNCTAGEDCAGECGGSAVVDECGVCGGNGSTCAQPEAFAFNQSTQQAFYFFDTATIGGESLNGDDWIGSFSNGYCSNPAATTEYICDLLAEEWNPEEICVGARRWGDCGEGSCDVPAMGADGTEYTMGYMTVGVIPTFKIYDSSNNVILDAIPSEDYPWATNGMFTVESLESACDPPLEIDECGVCGGDGIADGNCDCDGNVDLGCGCGEAGQDADGCCGEDTADCNGDCGGTAEDLGCGCGEAGPSGCDNACNSTAVVDCAGVCDGSSVLSGCDDACNSTAVVDCAGVCDGSSVLSGCDDVCNSTAVVDCAGVCDGSSVLSGCDDVCNSTAVEDCAGVCDGLLVDDECGVCGGSGIPDGDCDCAGSVEDCAGVCGGSFVWATMCEDTDGDGLGNPGTETEECIDGGRDITNGCDLPDLNLFITSDGEVMYQSSEVIGGFQFNVEGATVSSGSGGDAGAAGFMVSASGTTVLAFSFSGSTIPAGCGTLVNLSLDGEATGLSGIVVSDAIGGAIPFVYYVGDDTELVADCTDEYPDCAANEFDCAGECGGTAELDECGVCGGDNSTCSDCNGDINGDAYIDGCEDCVGGNTGEDACPDDCAGVPNGDSWVSDCGCVAAGNSGDDCDDCAGVPYGNNLVDNCGICDNNPENDCIQLNIALDGLDLVSFYALPEDNSIENVLGGIEASNPGVLGEGTSANFVDGQWLGTLLSIDRQDGYWIRVTDETDLNVEGLLTDPSTVYSLHGGSNLISYPFAGFAPLIETIPEEAQNSIIGIITENASAYNSEEGWIGGLMDLSGTEGYWFITSEDVDFTYNPPASDNLTRQVKYKKVLPEAYTYSQSMNQAFYFVNDAKINGEPLHTDDLIIAYNGDVVVGARYWYGEATDMPAMGADGNANYAGYSIAGDIITFKVLDASTNTLIEMESKGETAWQNLGMSVIQLTNKLIPEEISFGSAYPNPFNPVTMVSMNIPAEMEVHVTIHDMLGREIVELANGVYSTGNYELHWDASYHASGIYFVKMIAGGQTNIQKLMLIK